MPKVRVNTSQGPTVSANPVRGGQMNVQTNAETFGGGSGLNQAAAAIQDTVDTLQKSEVLRQTRIREEAERQAKAARDIAVQDADLVQAKLEADIRAEGSKMTGVKAGGLQDYVGDRWKKGTEEIRNTLATEEAKLEFDKKSKVREAGLYGWTQSTMASEWVKHQDASDTAYMANEDALIVDNYKLEVPAGGGVAVALNTPGIELAIQRKEDAFMRMAQRKGLGPEEIQKGLREEREKTHIAIINRMLANGEGEMASEYYKANADQFGDKQATATTKIIESEQAEIEYTKSAEQIMDKVGTDLTKIDKYIDSISDPKERKKVKDKVNIFASRVRSQININEEKVSELLATGRLNVEFLENSKSNLSPDFYVVAKESMRFGEGTKLGTGESRDAKYLEMLQKYSKVSTGDTESRTEAVMNFRREVLASRPNLTEENFRKALSWTTGKELEAYQPKKSYMDAAMKFLRNSVMVATWPNPIITSFIDKAMRPETKPEDILPLAQVSFREMAYLENPALVGKTDVTNLAVNKTDGAKMVYPGQTKSKADKSVTKPDVPKGYVQMLDPKGGKVAVPEKNVKAAQERGYRVVNGNS